MKSVRMGPIRDLIMEELGQAPAEGLTSRQIIRSLQRNHDTVYYALQCLLKAGRVKRVGHGEQGWSYALEGEQRERLSDE